MIDSYEFVSHSNKMLVLLLPGEIEQVYEQFEGSAAQVYVLILFKKGNSCDRETGIQYDLFFVEKDELCNALHNIMSLSKQSTGFFCFLPPPHKLLI
ncbi:hypothetical protein BSAF29S_01853 [Bacillus safensis subsp. safensis]